MKAQKKAQKKQPKPSKKQIAALAKQAATHGMGYSNDKC